MSILEEIGLSGTDIELDLLKRIEDGKYPIQAIRRILYLYKCNVGIKRAIKLAKGSLVLDDFEFECFKNQVEAETLNEETGDMILNGTTTERLLHQRMLLKK